MRIGDDASDPLEVIDAMIRDAERRVAVQKFIAAYDAWMVAPNMCVEPLFEEMLKARRVLDD